MHLRMMAVRDFAHAVLAGWFGRGPQAAAIVAAILGGLAVVALIG